IWTWKARTSSIAAQTISPPNSRRRRRTCLWTGRFTAYPRPARSRPRATGSRSPFRAGPACPDARPRPAPPGYGSPASASAAPGPRAPLREPHARSAPLRAHATPAAPGSAATPPDSRTLGGRRTPTPRSGSQRGPASGRLAPRPQAGAPRTWVRRHLPRRPKHGLPRQRPTQRPPPTLTDRQFRRADAPAAPLPEGLLHPPVLQRVVGQHHEHAPRRQLVPQDGQRPLELLQLLVHRDPQRLEDPRLVLHTETCAEDSLQDLQQVVARPERLLPTPLHHLRRQPPRTPLLTVTPEHLRQLRLRGLVQQLRRRALPHPGFTRHAHVQRHTRAERESSRGLVHLPRGDPEVQQRAGQRLLHSGGCRREPTPLEPHPVAEARQ